MGDNEMSWIGRALAHIEDGDHVSLAKVLSEHESDLNEPQTSDADDYATLLGHLQKVLVERVLEDEAHQVLYYFWMLLARMNQKRFKLPSTISESTLADLAELNAQMGDDGDAFTFGWAMALHTFPESDTLLHNVLREGAEQSGYFYENTFSRAVDRTDDPDRKALFVALDQLSAYTQYCDHVNADRACESLVNLQHSRRKVPTLNVAHFREAENRLRSIAPFWNYLRDSDWVALETALNANSIT